MRLRRADERWRRPADTRLGPRQASATSKPLRPTQQLIPARRPGSAMARRHHDCDVRWRIDRSLLGGHRSIAQPQFVTVFGSAGRLQSNSSDAASDPRQRCARPKASNARPQRHAALAAESSIPPTIVKRGFLVTVSRAIAALPPLTVRGNNGVPSFEASLAAAAITTFMQTAPRKARNSATRPAARAPPSPSMKWPSAPACRR